MANAVGPMLGASVAAALGLRKPFLLAAGIVLGASGLSWILIPSPQPKAIAAGG
jgi:predicted MFS family arabinose efflux permease